MIKSRCQAELLKLLEEIDIICKENDIEYVLAGGTFIGAIRHEGFLPWDDDADIHMTRDNAEKFLALSQTDKFPSNRTIVCKRTYPNYPNPIWRYTALDSTAMQRSSFIEDAPKGLYIDIIIIQAVGDEESEQAEALECWEAFSEITTETYTLNSRRSHRVIDLYREAQQSPAKKKKIADDLYGRLTRYSDKDTHTYLILSQYMSKCYDREDIEGIKYVKFEDTELPVFKNAEKVLYKAYGETWFELPAKQEREQHITVYDYERPYTEYEKSYLQWVDTEAIHNMLKKKKEEWFSVLKDYQYVMPRTHYLSAMAPICQLTEYIKETGIDTQKWLAEGKYEELEVLFTPFYEALGKPAVKYWNLYLDLPDELLLAACYPQVMKGNYRMASKLISQRIDNKETPISDELQKLKTTCDTIAEMLRYTYSEPDPSMAREKTKEGLSLMPEQVHICRARAGQMLDDGEDTKVIKEYIKEALKQHHSDGELTKYLGDVAAREGDIKTAKEMYRAAEETLINGMILLEMQKESAEKGGAS